MRTLILATILSLSPLMAAANVNQVGQRLKASTLDEPYFLRVMYCGQFAGVMWYGPERMPGLAKAGQIMRDARLQKIVSEAYVAAKAVGNVHVQDVGLLKGACKQA